MEYVIRNCRQQDLGSLIRLCSNHAELEKATFDPAGKLEKLRHAIFSSNPKLFCQVVEASNDLVGYFTYTFDFSTWHAQTFLHMDCLYLEPEYRGMGIGKNIMEILKKISDDNNCVNIQWQTPAFNENAIVFYKRIGAHGRDKIRFAWPSEVCAQSKSLMS
jgi:ribosomal protein S18 acetylase RimI-like enzyme